MGSQLRDDAVRTPCEAQQMEHYTSQLTGIVRPFELVRLRPSVVTVEVLLQATAPAA